MATSENSSSETGIKLFGLAFQLAIILGCLWSYRYGKRIETYGNSHTNPEAVTLGDTLDLTIADRYVGPIKVQPVPLVVSDGKTVHWLKELISVVDSPPEFMGWWVDKRTGARVRPFVTDGRAWVTLKLSHDRRILNQSLELIVDSGSGSRRLSFHVTTPKRKDQYDSWRHSTIISMLVLVITAFIMLGTIVDLLFDARGQPDH